MDPGAPLPVRRRRPVGSARAPAGRVVVGRAGHRQRPGPVPASGGDGGQHTAVPHPSWLRGPVCVGGPRAGGPAPPRGARLAGGRRLGRDRSDASRPHPRDRRGRVPGERRHLVRNRAPPGPEGLTTALSDLPRAGFLCPGHGGPLRSPRDRLPARGQVRSRSQHGRSTAGGDHPDAAGALRPCRWVGCPAVGRSLHRLGGAVPLTT